MIIILVKYQLLIIYFMHVDFHQFFQILLKLSINGQKKKIEIPKFQKLDNLNWLYACCCKYTGVWSPLVLLWKLSVSTIDWLSYFSTEITQCVMYKSLVAIGNNLNFKFKKDKYKIII